MPIQNLKSLAFEYKMNAKTFARYIADVLTFINKGARKNLKPKEVKYIRDYMEGIWEPPKPKTVNKTQPN